LPYNPPGMANGERRGARPGSGASPANDSASCSRSRSRSTSTRAAGAPARSARASSRASTARGDVGRERRRIGVRPVGHVGDGGGALAHRGLQLADLPPRCSQLAFEALDAGLCRRRRRCGLRERLLHGHELHPRPGRGGLCSVTPTLFALEFCRHVGGSGIGLGGRQCVGCCGLPAIGSGEPQHAHLVDQLGSGRQAETTEKHWIGFHHRSDGGQRRRREPVELQVGLEPIRERKGRAQLGAGCSDADGELECAEERPIGQARLRRRRRRRVGRHTLRLAIVEPPPRTEHPFLTTNGCSW